MKSSAGWEAGWSESRSVIDFRPKTEKQCVALSLGMALLFFGSLIHSASVSNENAVP